MTLDDGQELKSPHPSPHILTYIQQGSGNPPNPPADGGDQYVGLDRFGRVVDQRWIKTSTSTGSERNKSMKRASSGDTYFLTDPKSGVIKSR
jgi:hypothetical protein